MHERQTLLLWEILVPSHDNTGIPFLVSHHKAWDAAVMEIAGGLTIGRASRGLWNSPESRTYEDKVIPVKIACSREEIRAIADMTLRHYDQEAVMYYLVSSEAVIARRVS